MLSALFLWLKFKGITILPSEIICQESILCQKNWQLQVINSCFYHCTTGFLSCREASSVQRRCVCSVRTVACWERPFRGGPERWVNHFHLFLADSGFFTSFAAYSASAMDYNYMSTLHSGGKKETAYGTFGSPLPYIVGDRNVDCSMLHWLSFWS